MNFPDYVQSCGLPLKKQTSGGEWAGPCPFCGGNDRFRVFETGGRVAFGMVGRYFCRQCGAKGDAVSWFVDVEGRSFGDVSGADNKGKLSVSVRPLSRLSGPCPGGQKPQTVQSVRGCPETWSVQAEKVLKASLAGLKTSAAAEFYKGRGIEGKTCKALSLGWQAADSFFPPELWGETGKKIVVPAGCVLPVHRSGRVVSLLVRRADSSLWDKWGKWCEVRGGAKVPFICGPMGVPLVVCESVLCAVSVYQVTMGEVAAVALLGASKGLDAEALAYLNEAPVVLVAGDRDEGGDAVFPMVRGVRNDAVAYSVPDKVGASPVKDINDLLMVGGPTLVLGWLAHGLAVAVGDEPKEESPSLCPENEETRLSVAPVTEDAEDTVSHETETWGDVPGEVDVVAAVAREKFPEPPIDGRAFPHFPTFCDGYGKGCGACRFFHQGHGPFCLVWGAAWPNFQRNAETDTATW